MKGAPGTLTGGGASFATTHWSVVAAAANNDNGHAAEAETALARLCHDYWPPLYSFVRRRGCTREDAQDLVQGFFAFLLRTKGYAKTDASRGKFRSFLLASLKNYIADVRDREQAFKRGGGNEFVLLDDEVEAVETTRMRDSGALRLDEELQYERRWAATLVERALQRVSDEFPNSRARIFDELKPFLTGGPELPSQQAVAARLEMPIETLRSHLSRLRARYRLLLREEVARTVGRAEDVDEELHHLRSVLVTAC